ncbi:ribosomal protection-like ABC-F family protein [Fusibacter sp. JL298sf-3]
MSIIHIKNLTFAYPGSYENVFNNVTLVLESDWKLGFTGRNGRGKTTFLKLLAGHYSYKGTIQTSVTFDYYPQDISPAETRTVGHLVDHLAEAWQVAKEMNALGLPEAYLNRAYHTLSAGEQTKVQMMMLFLKPHRFLLIDEPTNHLDQEGRRQMMAYLNKKKGFIVVSHDREFLDGCTDHTLSINKTHIEIQRGSYSSYLRNKALKDGFEQRENSKLEKEIHTLSKAVQRTEGWSHAVEATKIGLGGVDRGYIGAKSAKMMKRSKAIQKRKLRHLEEKEKLLKDIESAVPIELKPLAFRTEKLVTMKDLGVAFTPDTPVIKGLDLEIKNGERIVLEGGNGAGKSTVLKALMGECPHTGTITAPNDLIISYVPQEATRLSGTVKNYIKDSGVAEWLLVSMLEKLDFSPEWLSKPIHCLSEGQKKKLMLAKSLCEKAHLYIWDEPLNYIDIHSREQLENLILTYQPTLILVEHDAYFKKRIATRVVTI